MRPEISDETEQIIRKWIEENPDNGIRGVGPAIDYLIPKAINEENNKLTEKEVEAVREILNQRQI